MTITIRHLDGPLAGQEQSFDDSYASIVFGRDPEACQVVYPPDYTVVGRRHFELRRGRAGDYTIGLFGKRYVEIDGVPAEEGMPVRSGSIFRLGRPDGPSFKIQFQSEMAEIAWSSTEADSDAGDYVAEYPREPWEGVVDLLVRRKSEAPDFTVGIPAEIFSKPSPAGARNATAETYSRPTGVGSGGAPSFRPLENRPPRGTLGRVPQMPSPDAAKESARQMPARARRGGVLWWLVIAGALAALGYLLYRREVLLGAVLGKLLHASIPPPPAAKAAGGELVDVSLFGPSSVQAEGEGLIQVFLHKLGQREIAKALAKEADPDAARRGVQTLAAEIAQGQRVEIILEGRGLDVDQEMQPLIWRGEPCACQFTVSAPKGLVGRTLHPRVIVLVDSVPVGSLIFALKVTRAAAEAGIELRGDRARRYTYAFLSYASPDRAEVIKRAQGLKAGGTNFFNDLLSLEPGERWEKRLYEEIDRCDVFYLFWSSQAKDLEWVLKEAEYALARRAASQDGIPDIIPVIIEGPPPAARPDSLKDIHFNDSLIYVLAGIEAVRPRT